MKLWIYTGIGLLLGATSCSSIKKVNVDQAPQVPHNTAALQVQEQTVAAKTIALTSDMQIVEPNSSLTVTVNTSALSDQLAGTTLSADVSAKLKQLLAMVQQQQQAMQDVAQALLVNTKNPKSPDWRPYMQKLNGFVKLILNNPDTHAIFTASLPQNAPIAMRYQTLFTTAQAYIAQLEAQIQQEAKSNGVYVQLGAWLVTKSGQTPIHIPGYDDYSPQPSSVVEQFQYTLTAEQQQELTAIGSLATNANQKGLGTALKDAVNNNGGLLTVLKTLPCYQTAVKLQDTLQNITMASKSELAALQAPVTDAYQSLQSFITNLDKAVKTFSTVDPSVTPSQLLVNVNTSISNLVTQTATLKAGLAKDVTAINSVASTADNQVMTYVRSLNSQLDTLADAFQDELTHLKSNIGDALNTAITSQNLASATYDFTTQVSQLSLDNALKPAVINLEIAGARDEGDMVTIRLATGKPGQPVVEQALLQYHLYFCSLYARTATGFLFVNPTPLFQTSDGKALFHYSASYSILLKGFWEGPVASRKDLSYHSLFNPGVGVNFSALNFNPNGTTELGIGGVFTLFNDFFQAGYGFDTVSGRGYMFFGFKIPVGSFSFQ